MFLGGRGWGQIVFVPFTIFSTAVTCFLFLTLMCMLLLTLKITIRQPLDMAIERIRQGKHFLSCNILCTMCFAVWRVTLPGNSSGCACPFIEQFSALQSVYHFVFVCKKIVQMVEEDCKYVLFYIMQISTPEIFEIEICVGWVFFDEKVFILGTLIRNETVVPCERCSQYRSSSRGTLTTNL